MHQCPVNDCTEQVGLEMLMCQRHWFMVPAAIRRAVWNSWKNGEGAGTIAHRAAMKTAVRYVNDRIAREEI
jgi:hypothetical protein